jgi:hypothetical protein
MTDEIHQIIIVQAEAAKRGLLTIWTVYERPRDYPTGWIARMHEADGAVIKPHRTRHQSRRSRADPRKAGARRARLHTSPGGRPTANRRELGMTGRRSAALPLLGTPSMPDPLPSDVVATLKSDPTAALAAALILAGSFPDLVSWAVRVFSGQSDAANCELKPRASPRATGQRRARRAKGRHNSREAAAKHDQALLALMRANPGATVTEIIRMNGRPRNSTMLSLDRLEKAGHARRGKWTVVDPDLLEVPAPKPAAWIEPLSGARVARHAADGRVRHELTMA